MNITYEQMYNADLILNSIFFNRWVSESDDAGIVVKGSRFKEEIYYAINPRYWTAEHIPPSFYWNSGPPPGSPESRIKRRLDFEFRQIRKSLDPEGLIKPLVLSNLRSEDSYRISFLTSSCSKYDMDCPRNLLDKNGFIKYKDLITLGKKDTIEKFLKSVNKILCNLIGEEIYTEMLKCPKEQRTRFLYKMMKPQGKS